MCSDEWKLRMKYNQWQSKHVKNDPKHKNKNEIVHCMPVSYFKYDRTKDIILGEFRLCDLNNVKIYAARKSVPMTECSYDTNASNETNDILMDGDEDDDDDDYDDD